MCTAEHVIHVGDPTDIPPVDVRVEGGGTWSIHDQSAHVLHMSDVPRPDDAVYRLSVGRAEAPCIEHRFQAGLV